MQCGVYFHPSDENLSPGAPGRKTPLDRIGFALHQLENRYSPNGACEPCRPLSWHRLITPAKILRKTGAYWRRPSWSLTDRLFDECYDNREFRLRSG